MKYKLAKWLVKNRSAIHTAMTVVMFAAGGLRDLVSHRGKRPKRLPRR